MKKIFLDIKKGPKHWYKEVVTAKITPLEIALGFGVGIFCSMLALPIINLLLALAAIALLRVNKLAVMLGYILILWPLSPIVYYSSLKLGLWIFGKNLVVSISDVSFDLIKRYIAMFAIGNLLLAAATAIAFSIAVYGITKSLEILKKRKA
jgi:uncharacterized protein (DUF2062 family)